MTTKERYEGVLGWFAGKMPVAESELKYNEKMIGFDFQHAGDFYRKPEPK